MPSTRDYLNWFGRILLPWMNGISLFLAVLSGVLAKELVDYLMGF